MVCVFGFTLLVGTRVPHKDSQIKNIRTSGDILPVRTRKKAILGLGFRGTIRVKV